MLYVGTYKPKEIYIGEQKVSEIYMGNERVYPNGNNVTYVWDGKQTVEYVDYGESILKPNFTPLKSNCNFLGWSSSISSTTVLTQEIMGDDPVTLYAVWKYQDATILNSPVTATIDSSSWGSETPQTAILYTFDDSKYSTITITGCCDVAVAHWAESCTAWAHIAGKALRCRGWWSTDESESDDPEYDCYGNADATFTVDASSPIMLMARGDYYYASGSISKIMGTGKTVVG